MRKWQIGDITSAQIDKSKHVLIGVGGAAAADLHFHAGSKDTAEDILTKLESSRSLARASTEATAPSEAEPRAEPGPPPEPEPAPAPTPIQRTLPPPLRTDGAHSPSKKGVHFSEASPAIIPPRTPSPPGQAEQEAIGGLEAVALYDFQAQGDDELTVAEGDALWIIEQDGDEWWKCRNMESEEGVVPASYVEVGSLPPCLLLFPTKGNLQPTGAGRLPPRIMEPEVEGDDGAAEREAEELATAERAEREAREARERKEKQQQEQRARAAAAAAEVERKQKEKEKRDREEREREERARREKEREEEDAEDEARRERRAAKAAAKASRSSKSTSEGRKSVERRACCCHIHIYVILTASSRYSPRPKPDARVARPFRAVPCRGCFSGLQKWGAPPAQGERRNHRGAVSENVSRRYSICREGHRPWRFTRPQGR